MNIAMILAAAALGTAPAPAAQAAAPAPAPRETIVPLYLSHSRALVMLRIGAQPPLPMVFDTGTNENLIEAGLASGLSRAPAGTTHVVDAATGTARDVPSLSLGEARLGGAAVGTLVAAVFPYEEADAVGVVGPNCFPGNLVVVELGQGRVRLRPKADTPAPSAQATPYLSGLPAAPIEVSGHRLVAHLDSGNDAPLILPQRLMTQLSFHAPPAIIGQARSVGGTQDIYGARLRGDLRIGPLVLHDPDVTFMPGDRANVGLPVLRRLTLVLDPGAQRSWILQPPRTDAAVLRSYAGRFGNRAIRVDRSRLVYQRDGRAPAILVPVGEDLFENPANGDRIQFVRRAGRISGLDLVTAGGDTVSADRN